jgi:hypothetical protein
MIESILRVGMAEWQHRTQSNNSLNPTGNSLPLIENLSHDAVDSRRVNSGVMSALRLQSKKPPAAPQLNDVELVWIRREAG